MQFFLFRLYIRALLLTTVKTCLCQEVRYEDATILEARKFTIKVPADLVSGKSPLPGLQTTIFLLYLSCLLICVPFLGCFFLWDTHVGLGKQTPPLSLTEYSLCARFCTKVLSM